MLAAFLVLLGQLPAAAQQDSTVQRPPQPTVPILVPSNPASRTQVTGVPAPSPTEAVRPERDTTRRAPAQDAPAQAGLVHLWAPSHLEIFGRELFIRPTTQFQPVTTGPVDPSYRLAPGDQVMLVLTGDVEVSHTLEVTRDGTILVPQVGVLTVQGMSLQEVEDLLYERMSRVFTGVGRGPGATTQFSATMGRLRSNQVFLAGEMERPGAYLVSSVSTVFSALYAARGPNENGSYRQLQLRRGGEVVRTVDVYEYLLRGDSRNDVRLEQGDILFAPLAGRQIAVDGAVRRPAIYELRENEDLRDLLRFAGGLSATASISRIQIDRVLPPAQRRGAVERVLVDVDLGELARGRPIRLEDHDIVQVFSVTGERRNRVTVQGEVRRPGMVEWSPGMQLADVIERAEGLSPSAYTLRAHIYRLNEQDRTRTLIAAPLGTGGRPGANVPVIDRDSIVIYSVASLRLPATVSIRGWVKAPGVYALAEGMSVRDLILAAGGFAEGADTTGVDLARPLNGAGGDTIASVARVGLEDGGNAGGRGRSGVESTVWLPTGREYRLQHMDEVLVRLEPGHEPARIVYVRGEVVSPGPYALESRQTRLMDVLDKAGGLSPQADPAALRVVRDSLPVGTDYQRARRNRGSRFNLALESGDSIIVPALDRTVQVRGAVAFATRVLYAPGLSLEDYIAQAGGYDRLADRGRVSVIYPNGERATKRRQLIGTITPSVRPGSMIYVPARPEREPTDLGDAITKVMAGLTTAVSIFLAIDRL